MLDLKQLEVHEVGVLPGMQRVHLRLAGFRGGTVPALKIGGRRIQGSRKIARALEEIKPEPPLFPADPALRPRVEEAERWGEEELQPVPRRIFRWGLARDATLREWLSARSGVPAPAVAARLSALNARYYARVVHASDRAIRQDLTQLPAMLEHADDLLEGGTLSTDPPTAATLQVLSSVRALDAFTDLHQAVAAHPSAAVARELLPDYPEPVPPFLPREWVATLTPR